MMRPGKDGGIVPLAQCVNCYAGMVVLSRSHIDKLFGKDGGLNPACVFRARMVV
ncbi:uncharacterized protein DS421_11g336260 [Arachis hypogaea]|nr:uncharacterized protein DS421_11g336260 [Arachis hypogaea]